MQPRMSGGYGRARQNVACLVPLLCSHLPLLSRPGPKLLLCFLCMKAEQTIMGTTMKLDCLQVRRKCELSAANAFPIGGESRQRFRLMKRAARHDHWSAAYLCPPGESF